MAPKKLLITGTTGFIGSALLRSLTTKFTKEDLQITALLRNVPSDFGSRFPDVSIIRGTFDDDQVIRSAAAASDVVLHAGDSDHVGSIVSCLEGLVSRGAGDIKQQGPAYYIHLSGTGNISDQLTNEWLGDGPSKTWNDIRDLEDVHSLPEAAFHRPADRTIFEYGEKHHERIKTAIVAPGDIYGLLEADNMKSTSRGSVLIPWGTVFSEKRGRAFQLGKGENIRGFVSLQNVADVFILLVEQAVADGAKADWGHDGFYFVIDTHLPWGDVAKRIAQTGQRDGWLQDEEVDRLSKAELENLAPGGSHSFGSWGAAFLYVFGSNSPVEADRAKKIGWTVKPSTFWDFFEQDVADARKQDNRWE